MNGFRFLAETLEIASNAWIFLAAMSAFFVGLLLHRNRDEAFTRVTSGVLYGLSIKAAAALLKAILLTTWNQIGIFLVIYSMRLILKADFKADFKFGAQAFLSGKPATRRTPREAGPLSP